MPQSHIIEERQILKELRFVSPETKTRDNTKAVKLLNNYLYDLEAEPYDPINTLKQTTLKKARHFLFLERFYHLNVDMTTPILELLKKNLDVDHFLVEITKPENEFKQKTYFFAFKIKKIV